MTNAKSVAWRGCPIRYASANFGDKWSMILIRDIMFKDRRYYSEFLEAGEGISTNILADRLLKLENDGIIEKQIDPVKKSKKIYRLTEKGLALMPIMLSIIQWSEKYDAETEVPGEFIQQLEENQSDLENALLDNIARIDNSGRDTETPQ
ncbi:MAG: helix-turn-helix domain-containing protein [Sneathiella sp.]